MWHIFPKVDLKKLDFFYPMGYVTKMEHYFSHHGIIDDLMKLRVGVLTWIKRINVSGNGIRIHMGGQISWS